MSFSLALLPGFGNLFVSTSRSNFFLRRQDFLIGRTGLWAQFCSFRIRVKRDPFFRLCFLTPRPAYIATAFTSALSPILLELDGEEPVFFPLKNAYFTLILQISIAFPIASFLPTLIFIHLDFFKSGHLALRLAVGKVTKHPLNVVMFKEQDSPTLYPAELPS